MLIDFKYKGMPAYAFAIYNFSQISDAVLLVMADKKQQKLTMIFTYCDGCWQTSEDLSFLNAESFRQINDALTGLDKSNVYAMINEPGIVRENALPVVN